MKWSSSFKWSIVLSIVLFTVLTATSGCYYYKGSFYPSKDAIREAKKKSLAAANQGNQVSPQPVQPEPVQPVQPEPVQPVQPRPEPSVAYPVYKPLTQLKGPFNSLGSDTMEKIMEYCGEAFGKYHPQLRYRAESEGSSDAVNALASRKADVGPMSRPLKDKEAALLASTYSYPATQVPVALDALAVYINPNNPILERGMSLPEVDAIFSSTRAKGYAEDITTWGQLGLTDNWADKKIDVYSRNKISGTYGFFLKKALSTKSVSGKYKASNHEMYDSDLVVKNVAKDKFAIGYSGIGYNNPSVKTLPLSAKQGEQAYAPTPENVYSEKYPLWRYLYITVMINPDERVSDQHAEFIRFMYSKEAQELIKKAGYFPIEPKMALEQLKLLRLQ